MLKINITKSIYGSNGNMLLKAKLDIQEKAFIALTGESGSGKTTLLRILAGLEDANGSIQMGKDIWLNDKQSLKVQKRQIGFVFQDYALFPNMSVIDNLLFVQKNKNLANHLLEITELDKLKKRMPSTLSGGQKQRVALCRSMMNKPRLLLLDEPLSALDVKMRVKLQNEILTIHKEFNTTTIMVSHDPSEIYKLSNRVIVMSAGEIINDGLAKDILLTTSGSKKFSFKGEVVDIIKADIVYIAIISINQQLVEIVMSGEEVKNIKIGQRVIVGTKAFSPIVKMDVG